MATNNRRNMTHTPQKPKHDGHFDELLDLASEGNEEAVQDLWLQYDYDFAKKGRGDE